MRSSASNRKWSYVEEPAELIRARQCLTLAVIGASLFFTALISPLVARADTYTLQALPSSFLPTDLNDEGLIAGTNQVSGSPRRPYVLDTVTGAGTFIDVPGNYYPSTAVRINNVGELATTRALAMTEYQAFKLTASGLLVTIDLPQSNAGDINDSGTTVGYSSQCAFVQQGEARPSCLPHPGAALAAGPAVAASAINRQGLILSSRFFVWTPGAHSVKTIQPIGLSGGASKVNDNGEMVGAVVYEYGDHASAFWKPNGQLDLRRTSLMKNFRPGAINNCSQVVGSSSGPGTSWASIRDGDSPPVTLSSLVLNGGSRIYYSANKINNRGQILVDTQLQSVPSVRQYVLLTPTHPVNCEVDSVKVR